MATNLTRINNNQITDASTGNVYLGVNAAVKLQNYTVTSQKLANNINYQSDLQVTGNLTVTGTTTTVDTVNTLIEDPLIVLASGQTSGTPTVDIGYIGLRGVDNNIALAWKEGDSEFVAAFTTTDSGNSYSNTTFSIASYADFKANNITANGTMTVTGTTTFVGNIIAANVTNDVTAGNVYTVNNVSAAGNVLTGTYFIGDGGYISNINAGNVSTYKIFNGGSYANINTSDANLVVAIGNSSNLVATFYDTGVNLNGLLSVNGNITGGNITTTGPSGNISGANVISSTTLSASGNVYGSNIVTPNTVINGGVSSSGDILTSGNITATVNVTGGNIYTANVVSAGGNVLGSAIYATGSGDISTAGNVWAGIGVNTPNVVSATALALTAQSGDVNISATGNIGVNNLYIQNLHDPLENQDAATKYYVDTVAQGLTIIASTYAAALQPLANISGGTITYNNGNAGVGANLVTTGAYTTIDSVNIAVANTRILVAGQANAVQNGVYVYSNATVLTRSADYDIAAQIQAGDFVFNQYGNTYGNTQWVQTANVTTIGTDPITFTQFGGAGTYTAGNGIVINGVVISARVDTDTITFSGTGNLKVSDTANLVSPNIGNATGSSLSIVGTITADINVSVGGNVISGNINVGNNVSAGGNIYGGNISTTGSGGNITGANVISGTTLTATGNVYGGNLVAGNITIPSSGNINAGTNYINNVIDPIQAQDAATKGYVDGFISGGITIADTDANTTVLALNGTLSLIGTTNQVNVHITGPDAVTFSFPTDISIAGNVEAGNVNAGNVNAGNIVISSDDITDTNGRVNFNSALSTVDFAVNGTAANVFYVNATSNSASFGSSTQTVNALVAFNTSTSILAPVGNTNQRPETGVTGMLRFNSTTNSLEIYNNTQWIGVGSTVFTVIADEQFAGDGSTVAYTLGSTQTTNSVIVSINGVLQIPTTAYSVSGVYPTCVLTFTEAPEPGDSIDVREITTTTSVNSITNPSESAKLLADPTLAQIDITGNLIPTANVAYSLGNINNQWKSLYVSGNTIYLGGLQLQASGNTFTVYQSDGSTPATLDVGNIDVSSITAGNSSLGFYGTSGNAFITVNGTANVLTATITGVSVTGTIQTNGTITGGNLSAGTGYISTGGNVTGGNVLYGAGVVSGTGTITAATVNAATIGNTGAQFTGASISAATIGNTGAVHNGTTVSVTGNVTGGNVLYGTGVVSGTGIVSAATVNAATIGNTGAVHNGTTVSVTGNVTGGNVTGGNVIYGTGVVSGTGTVYAATVNAATIGNASASLIGATVSATGNVTGGNVIVSGVLISTNTISATGNITGGNISIGSGSSTAGSYSASGNITGGNVVYGTGVVSGTGTVYAATVNAATIGNASAVHNGATVSVTGNVTGGNISAGTGTVYAGTVNAATIGNTGAVHNGTTVSVTGNVTGGNVIVSGVLLATNTISASGNITGGNILAGTGTISTSGSVYGTLQTASQTNITSVGTLGSLNVTGNVSAGGLAMSTANATIGNLYVTGNTTIAGNITQISGNSGQFFGNASTGFNALYAGLPAGYVLLPQSIVTFIAQYPGYSQLNNQNQSSNNIASTDYVLTSDNGTDTTYFVDLGIASSTYNGTVAINNNGVGNAVTPNDGYLYATGNVAGGNPSDFVFGSGDIGGQVRFVVGGTTTANVVMKLNAPNTNAASSVTGTVVVTGGIGLTGNIYASGTVTAANHIGTAVSVTGNIVTGSGGFIGVGTSTPDSDLNIVAYPQTVSYTLAGNSTAAGTDLHISGADSSFTRITQDSFGTGVYVAFTGRAARGTAASPSQTLNNDVLSQFTARGYSNGSLQFGNTSTGRLDVVAAENFTDTSRATNMVVYTTASGAITPTAVATFSSANGLSVAGNVTGGNVIVSGVLISTNTISATGNITGGNISIGSGSSTAGSYSASGNITGGNVVYGTGVVSGTGTVYAATVNAATIGNASAVHNGATVSATGNVTGGNIIATGVLISSNTVSVAGNITGGNISAGSGASTAGSYSASGNITGGNVTTAGQLTVNSGANVTAIVNGATSGVGNIGSASNYFNTVFAKATSAQYADLAEMYTADAEYAPGTVVSFGGNAEVTLSDTDADRRIAGVVSTNPSYLMNATLAGDIVVAIALTGRVPCHVIGSVRKGDMMVSASNGQARAEPNPAVGTVIGKALEDFDGESGIIEVVVGRL